MKLTSVVPKGKMNRKQISTKNKYVKSISCAALIAIFKVLGGLNTFHYIQDSVQDGTEHILDIAHHSTCELINNTEDTSAYVHRIYVANVSFSWENKDICKGKNLCINIKLSFYMN